MQLNAHGAVTKSLCKPRMTKINCLKYNLGFIRKVSSVNPEGILSAL